MSLLTRKLDDVPTRPELLQYEKRFVELYEAVQVCTTHPARCEPHSTTI